MTKIYYLLILLPIIWEITVISDLNTIFESFERITLYGKDDKNELNSTDRVISVFMIFYLIWAVIGLLSSNYGWFALLIGLSVIPKKKKWILLADAILSLIILIIIVIRVYH